MLELCNLTAGYSQRQVLKELSLTIPSGKVTVIAGPNGCGKSTLLKAVAGVLDSEGEVVLNGQSLSKLPPKVRAQKIAYLPQSRVIPEITVRRLVLHGRFPYLQYPRQYRKVDYAAAEWAMAELGITHLADRSLPALSGGQRQKAYLAMALAQDTEGILLDEPTTYLDISQQLQTMVLARQLAEKGKTVVLVLHDLALALEYGDHLILLQDGALAAQGDAEAVFASGKLPQVFGVEVKRTMTDAGWKYYCTLP